MAICYQLKISSFLNIKQRYNIYRLYLQSVSFIVIEFKRTLSYNKTRADASMQLNFKEDLTRGKEGKLVRFLK